MYNPLETLKRFQSRIGKPIRPIIELQKDASVVNIITTTIQTENMISDTYRQEAWEILPSVKGVAIYVDGIFKGIGFFAGEEGQILEIKKDVTLQREVEVDGKDENGEPIKVKKIVKVLSATYKGIFGRALDASIIERGSALKPSMMQTMIYCAVCLAMGIMAGISYAGH